MKEIIQTLKKIIKYLLGMGHECEFTKIVRNDMNTKWLNVCWLCGAQDGKKFWAEMNELYYKKFPEERPTNQAKQ